MSEKFDIYNKIFFRDVGNFFRHLCELVQRHQMRVSNYFVNSFYSVPSCHRPSANYSQAHSGNFGNFLRRLTLAFPIFFYTFFHLWKGARVSVAFWLDPVNLFWIHILFSVRRGPDRIGLLGKPPASSAFLTSRASSHTCFPTFPTHQRQYEAIRVWSYTTFIVYGSQWQETSGRNLKGEDKY